MHLLASSILPSNFAEYRHSSGEHSPSGILFFAHQNLPVFVFVFVFAFGFAVEDGWFRGTARFDNVENKDSSGKKCAVDPPKEVRK